MIYLILNYSDYPEKPTKIFCGNSETKERKNLAETQFVVWCESVDCPCLDWVSGADKANVLTQEQIITEMKKAEWDEDLT